MDIDPETRRRVFFDVHRDLPREGPGDSASTARALSLVGTRLDADAIERVLDVGCGPGTQTSDLARLLPRAWLLAVDLHLPFLRQLRERMIAAGTGDRVIPVRADMSRLPVAEAAIDLLWCEGAAYIMGVERALDAWWPLLRPGGCLSFTEAVWLRPDPPALALELWTAYPGMTDGATVAARVERHGYELIGSFVLPAEAWLDDYYEPMARRLDQLVVRYRGDAPALAVLHECRHEIDVYRAHGDCYGYAFFVAQKPGR